jgi:CRISPR-associated protein Csd1
VILQALTEYYDRRCAVADGALAPLGWEWKRLPFIFEITPEGGFVQIVDTRVADGKRMVAKEFLVPAATKRAVNVAANLLWDNLEYALGVPVRNDPIRVRRCHLAFVEAITDRFGSEPNDDGVAALLRFLREPPLDEIERDSSWPEVLATNPFVSFRLQAQPQLVCECEMPADPAEGGPSSICLVTGRKAAIARLHPPLKGVRGSNTTGASLVSFNLAAFESYGHEQGGNAPVSQEAVFKYTTALNALLASDSRRKAWMGDATFVFWAQRQTGELVERGIADLFSDPAPDDPDRSAAGIRDLLAATSDGSWSAVPDGRGHFYVLGLTPNAARAAVRTWTVATAVEVAQRLISHFDDIEVARPSYAPEHPSLFRLLRSVALQGKPENIPPNLQGDVASAILTGRPYPISLLAAALRRSCAEGDVNPERAALIKAVVNRHRRASGEAREELSVALDTANADPAYRLGRLFAALERAQETASPGLNATIRDRYYGAASSTPITVFPRLLDLKNHHIAKIDSPNARAWLERLIGEIVDGIPKIPAHLSLIQQGDFAIGYYHQRQDFFRKHTSEGETH